MNQTIQMGRLGKDVEVKYTKSGKAFGTFSIAVPRVYRDKNTGEFVENTNWFDVVVSEKLLEFKGERLVSGALVLVTGELQQNRWETDKGEKRSKIEIIANKIEFIGGSSNSDGAKSQGQRYEDVEEEEAPAPAAKAAFPWNKKK